MTWRERGRCYNTADTRFTSHSEADIKAALAICRPCPVKAECLALAEELLEDKELVVGVWGGQPMHWLDPPQAAMIGWSTVVPDPEWRRRVRRWHKRKRG